MKEYAVLYKKEVYDAKKGVIFLKPYYIIDGITDKENHIFLDSLNEERYFVESKEIMELSVEFCVGNTFTEEELLKEFPKARSIEEAKVLLLEEKKSYLIVGVYREDKITIGNILIDDFALDMLQDERNLEDESYQNLKKRFGIEDFSFFLKEEMEELLNINNLDELRNKMIYVMNHKEAYQEKLGDDKVNREVIYLLDDTVQELLSVYNLEEIKEYLKDCIINVNKKREELTNQNTFTLLDFYQTNYNKILMITSLEQMREWLQDCLKTYQVVFNLIDELELEPQHYESVKKLLYIQYATIEKLMEYSSLEQIIQDYKNIYENSIESIEKASELLDNYGFLLTTNTEIASNNISQEKKEELESNITDKLAFNYLEVYDYMVSKVINRNEQIDAILSTIDMVDNNPNKDKKQACLIAGTTGTGKTQTFTELKRALPNRPIVLVDTNQITSQGYVGNTIEDAILAKLVEEAHKINQKSSSEHSDKITAEDIVLAEHGIVFLDEIDKRRENATDGPDVNGKGVIDQLLKMMDGTDYRVNISGDSIIIKQMISFNTSNLVIFAGGAFQEYFELQDKRLGYRQETKDDKFTKNLEVNPEELVKYGLSSQFIGRFNRVILYPPHTKETLLELENNKTTSNIENEKNLFEQLGVKLIWANDFLEAIAEKALELKKGGRSLNYIISRCLNYVYSEIKKYPDEYKIVYLEPYMIDHPEEVLLIKNDNSYIRVKDIKERNRVLAQKQYRTNKVEMDQNAYLEVLSMLENIKKEEHDRQYTLKKVDY